MNHYDNGQTVLNDWTAVRVTVGQGWVYGMTDREGYENPTYPPGLRFKDTKYDEPSNKQACKYNKPNSNQACKYNEPNSNQACN